MRQLKPGKSSLLLILITCTIALACNPKFDLFAPEKTVYVVYGVLNPKDSVQYIRISKAFQYEGDAYEYIAKNDLSVTGLEVTLTGPNGIQVASEIHGVATEPQEGLFHPFQSLYQFSTQGANQLIPGARYDLTVHLKETDSVISAFTIIPLEPTLLIPGGPLTLATELRTYPSMGFTRDLDFTFLRNGGKGFELRINLHFLHNGEPEILRYGPTPVFSGAKGCGLDHPDAEIGCYQIREYNYLNFLIGRLKSLGGEIEYSEFPSIAFKIDSIRRVCEVEITSVDSFMNHYLTLNNPATFGPNLLLDKPEYTNVSGDHIGIFGAYNTSANWIYLSACSKFLMKFSNPQFPLHDCDWPPVN